MSILPLTNEYQPVIILGDDTRPYDEALDGQPGVADRLCEILDGISSGSIDHTVRQRDDGVEVIFVKLKVN